MHFMSLVSYTVVKISLIYKHQNFILLFGQVNICICSKFHIFAPFEPAPYSHYIIINEP